MKFTSKYLQVSGAFVLATIVAGCNGSDNNGGPSPLPSPTVTVSPTASPTATASPTSPGSALNVIAIQRNSNGSNVALRFNSTQLSQVTRTNITGLPASVSILGIDRRPRDGRPYILGSDRRLYVLNNTTFAATPVGGALTAPVSGSSFGFDFNPVPDRIRLVSNEELNLRLNPDTGGAVDANADAPGFQGDGRLAYISSDVNAGRDPNIVAAAYTNSSTSTATTTINYAIDSRLGILVTQGTVAGSAIPVSPNTGQLFTVGSLGVAIRNSGTVSFDIGADNRALAVIDNSLYSVNLASGAATMLGAISGTSNSGPIVGLVIVP